MERKKGIHFYINIANLDDVNEEEERQSGNIQHALHAMDTFFTAIETYGKKYYPNKFVVEKITGSRLHLYVVENKIAEAFEIVFDVSGYAYFLILYLNNNVGKYRKLLPFELKIGVCHGTFCEFEFVNDNDNVDELTTIGYAANYAAKLQGFAKVMRICVSENVYENMNSKHKNIFSRIIDSKIQKYDQKCYYQAFLSDLSDGDKYKFDLIVAGKIANHVNLGDMQFRDVLKPLSFNYLSKTECRRLNGIPLFADVRGFTSHFDSEDANLDKMANLTRELLTKMYTIIKQCNGTHVQFQGDREFAVFNDYPSYCCVVDAVIAALKIIDAVGNYGVCVGVGESYGKLFAAKIGARGEKDNILLGRTVSQADKNEDDYADKNQLVISQKIYDELVRNSSLLASVFEKEKDYYYTNLGYQGVSREISKRRLFHDNKTNNYNGAWGSNSVDGF